MKAERMLNALDRHALPEARREFVAPPRCKAKRKGTSLPCGMAARLGSDWCRSHEPKP